VRTWETSRFAGKGRNQVYALRPTSDGCSFPHASRAWRGQDTRSECRIRRRREQPWGQPGDRPPWIWVRGDGPVQDRIPRSLGRSDRRRDLIGNRGLQRPLEFPRKALCTAFMLMTALDWTRGPSPSCQSAPRVTGLPMRTSSSNRRAVSREPEAGGRWAGMSRGDALQTTRLPRWAFDRGRSTIARRPHPTVPPVLPENAPSPPVLPLGHPSRAHADLFRTWGRRRRRSLRASIPDVHAARIPRASGGFLAVPGHHAPAPGGHPAPRVRAATRLRVADALESVLRRSGHGSALPRRLGAGLGCRRDFRSRTTVLPRAAVRVVPRSLLQALWHGAPCATPSPDTPRHRNGRPLLPVGP